MPSTVSNAVLGLMSFHPNNIPEVDTHSIPCIPFSFISEETEARVACTVTKIDLLSYLLYNDIHRN